MIHNFILYTYFIFFMNNITQLKKKIIYRSQYRGTKEMDILLGKFVKKYINIFTLYELKQLNEILSIDDKNLYNWYLNKKIEIKIPENKVSVLLKNFKI